MMGCKDVSEVERRSCACRCGSDSALYKEVRRRCGFNFVGKNPRSFVAVKVRGVMRGVVRESGVGEAWMEMQSNTRMLTGDQERDTGKGSRRDL